MNTDETQLPELTRRQEEILAFIIHSYTDKPEPVGSKYLVENYDLSFSPATVRNEMAVLEDLGYITSPHTSAGRVPTANGYRYFVKRLLHSRELSPEEKHLITGHLQSSPLATDQWMRKAASVLAQTAQTAALVTPPAAETSRFKHLELIAIQGRLVLMVLVLRSGIVQQQMLNLAEPIPQERLSEVAALLNATCDNLVAKEVRMKSTQLQILEQEIAELIADLLEKADLNQARVIYRDGVPEIISTFPDNEGAQQAVRLFEEIAFLNLVLAEVLSPLLNNVQVVIGGEGRWEELSHLSMVLSRYGIPGQISGAVGVLGPTHINYSRAVSSVQYISNVMSNMLLQVYDHSVDDAALPLDDPSDGDD